MYHNFMCNQERSMSGKGSWRSGDNEAEMILAVFTPISGWVILSIVDGNGVSSCQEMWPVPKVENSVGNVRGCTAIANRPTLDSHLYNCFVY